MLSEIRAALTTTISRRAFGRLRGRKGLKVHLGCGDDIREGWVNIDLKLPKGACSAKHDKADTVLINHDLRLGLPLEESSCESIYSSHLIEHLELRPGLRLLRDCYLALCPDGTCRVVLPDYRRVFSAYLESDAGYFKMLDETGEIHELEPGTNTLVDRVNYSVYQYGQHKYIYDEEKLIAILSRIGFTSVYLSSFQPEIDHPSALRRQYSLYLEARK